MFPKCAHTHTNIQANYLPEPAPTSITTLS